MTPPIHQEPRAVAASRAADSTRNGSAPPDSSPLVDERVAELERRIAELEALEDSAFGGFSAWDWLACVIGALLVPALAAWWFAG